MEQWVPKFVEVRTPLPRNPNRPEGPRPAWEPYRRSTRWQSLRSAPQFLCIAAFLALACVLSLPISH